jgi:hypothetical protein
MLLFPLNALDNLPHFWIAHLPKRIDRLILLLLLLNLFVHNHCIPFLVLKLICMHLLSKLLTFLGSSTCRRKVVIIQSQEQSVLVLLVLPNIGRPVSCSSLLPLHINLYVYYLTLLLGLLPTHILCFFGNSCSCVTSFSLRWLEIYDLRLRLTLHPTVSCQVYRLHSVFCAPASLYHY